MRCRELVELVTDYFDGALSPEDTRRFEEHIALCDGCARYVEQMRVTVRTVGRVDEDPLASLSSDARQTLLQAFKDWHGGARPLPGQPG
jgi:anti-sigma factor RsiW